MATFQKFGATFQKFRGPYYAKRATEFLYGAIFPRVDRAIVPNRFFILNKFTL